jgi:hypothetical protein
MARQTFMISDISSIQEMSEIMKTKGISHTFSDHDGLKLIGIIHPLTSGSFITIKEASKVNFPLDEVGVSDDLTLDMITDISKPIFELFYNDNNLLICFLDNFRGMGIFIDNDDRYFGPLDNFLDRFDEVEKSRLEE